jgi:hypothetical protein
MPEPADVKHPESANIEHEAELSIQMRFCNWTLNEVDTRLAV